MAARIRKIRHDDETRKKIQAGVIITMLMDHIRGQRDLSPAQVTSAKTLLNKVLPDLKAVELTGEDGGPVDVYSRIELVAPDLSDDEEKDAED